MLSRFLTKSLPLILVIVALGTFGMAAAQDKTVVTYWAWNPAGFGNTLDGGEPDVQQVAFNAAHPEIDLQVEVFSYPDYLSQLQLNMASSTGPDIVAVQAGALLNTYKEFFVDLTPRAEAAWGADWADQFYPLGLDQTRSAEGTFGLPMMNSAAGFLWYNKTIFDQEGLTPPTNWDEWVAVSNALTEKGIPGFFHGAADSWVNYDMFISLANEIAPGKIYEAEAGTVPWTDPDLVMAMDYWGQMFSNGIMQTGALAATQYPDTHQAFTTGKAGMMLMGVWNNYAALTNTGVSDYQTSYGFTENYEYGTIPFPDINGDGEVGRPFGGPDVVVALNQSSAVQDAAWTVMRWMMGQESQTIQAARLNVPAIKGIPFDDSDATGDFAKQVLTDQLVQLEGASGKREFLYPEIKTALADAMQNVAAGLQTPEEAMAAIEEVSQTIAR